jgi:hypothetical protein
MNNFNFIEKNKYQETLNNNKYNVNINHPLIPNSQEYMYYKKFVSIHSEDRDILAYPNSTDFEIELPEDMLNVASIRLIQWTFPANYSTFSVANNNVNMSFKINNPYNPGANFLSDEYNERVFQALWEFSDNLFDFSIEEGFYNPDQMTTELTNKMNYSVTRYLLEYFNNKGWTDSINQLQLEGGYNRFIVVYNNVSLKIWFGNICDGFILNNEIQLRNNQLSNQYSNLSSCTANRGQVPDSSSWGLPGYLGLPRCDTTSISSSSFSNTLDVVTYNGIAVPRFYYGDVKPGDNGYWLLPNPNLTGSNVYWVEAIYKINLLGEAYIYMELFEQNCIDETQPWNLSRFNLTTNKTNGIVNSSFAKLPIPSTPLSQWFDRDSIPYKYYYPPAERIRKLKIKLRYHNGQSVDFGIFNYSFMLEFNLFVPQILRNSKTIKYPSYNES